MARGFPDRLFIAVDTNPESLSRIARQAGRKPSRGGVSNLLCIAEAAEALGQQLPGVADQVSVILPWGRLLRTVAEPNLEDLRNIVALGQTGATFEVLFSYDPCIDGQGRGPLGTGGLDEKHVKDKLPAAYELVGLAVKEVKRVSLNELKTYATTWAKRLAHGRAREVWRIKAVRRA
jgi:16S rRNA (adenine(1408)-N(1))-methyltransferase